MTRPAWLNKKIALSGLPDMKRLLRERGLHTVCEEAACPNISECFSRNQATFLILGDRCTRDCAFCNVAHDRPLAPDPDEPARVAEAVKTLGLRHAVVTSPTRDDLPDGGAFHFAETVRLVRERNPGVTVEILVPDFQGEQSCLDVIARSGADIVGHNLETVPRLYPIRRGASYGRSLTVLKTIRQLDPAKKTKSGLMLGLGETPEEIRTVMGDLRAAGCDYLSLGQYLAPGLRHHPVREFIPPDRFDALRGDALAMGFLHVESGPYVRSSYHASDYLSGNGN